MTVPDDALELTEAELDEDISRCVPHADLQGGSFAVRHSLLGTAAALLLQHAVREGPECCDEHGVLLFWGQPLQEDPQRQ